MRLKHGQHLTYCTNIHPGETWGEVRQVLARYVLGVKKRVCPDRPFGVGLRLSGAAAAQLAQPETLQDFRRWLARHDLYVFTLNGFPYGRFSAAPVKEQVYQPDWLEPERLRYTNQLAQVLAALLPEGETLGTVSTVPLAYRPRVQTDAAWQRVADQVVEHAQWLDEIRNSTGKTLVLGFEPEPGCALETTDEAVTFFERQLFARSSQESLLRRHIGVCFDACHAAVAYEASRAALGQLVHAGIRVAKIQLSAGLEVPQESCTAESLSELRAFANGTYLHQVVRRDRMRWGDLPQALMAADLGASEFRVHFHVPLFLAELGRFRSTQSYVEDLLAQICQASPTTHLEVETYSWNVLPPQYRTVSVKDAIARELKWVIDRLN